ncbi:MAG: phosphonate ABC transporter ATP-binding protein [Armatimonadota bacterium]|nr:phosphonate ABC transporter ATP-binding protein [Armatimonadota bacterium]
MALDIAQLRKVYPDGTVALDGIDLLVPDGQFLAVIGLSGSGKSTLMRCINRLIEPTSGTITLDGIDVTSANRQELRRIRGQVGMIFQQFNLVKRSSVLTNTLAGRLGYVDTFLSLINWFPSKDRELAMLNLTRVGIAEKAEQRADTLSGGQQQRVGIARALTQKPKLILADEPVASLDPATAHSILDYLEQANKQDGITVVCSLHFLSLARRYADRVIALKAGKIVFDGPPDEIDDTRFKEIYGEGAEEVEVT